MINHIAIIMDGNGRWAKAKGMPRTFGHKQGAENVRTVALEANKMGIKALTLYAFSTENWKRPEDEVDFICKLPKMFFNMYIKELVENNIRVSYIGELEKFPSETKKFINAAIEKTKNNTGMEMVIAINYGSRREIVMAAQQYAKDVIDGKKGLEISEDEFSQYLMTAHLPEVDLLVRTSGEQRLSNYLLWQLAYAEFVFVDYAWPEFTAEKLHEVIAEYERRDRRFG
ncbi:MAG: isoprenyl transferase, partial [Erysipelotrichia bacterium]|nr:isoprenyl transferase [Erysipelotrichia bacterium]